MPRAGFPAFSRVRGRGVEVMAETDAQDIHGVAQVAANQLQAAVTVVPPADRHLRDHVAGLAREIQDFDVEHIAVDALPAEDVESGLAAEELEAALCVDDVVQSDDGVKREPERLRPQPPVPELGPLDMRVLQSPRADHDIGALRECVFELVELRDRRLVIRVDETDTIAARDGARFADAAPLAAPFPMADHPQSRITGRQVAYELPRAVVSIRRDNHLE